MRKEEFTKGVLSKIKEALAEAGVPEFITEQLDIVIYVILIIVVAYITGRVLHKISTSLILHLQKKNRFPLLANLIEYNVLRKISLIVPPIIVIWLLPVVFTHHPKLSVAFENIAWVYFIILLSAKTLCNSIMKGLASDLEVSPFWVIFELPHLNLTYGQKYTFFRTADIWPANKVARQVKNSSN